ncbi:CAP domain-containing protein [Natronolimnohabitans innermongolicus]|uniref:SCP domain-containing protein n=1 Tax=Natronolimnohabitans innermongolicus JCM 12255 TaxID=1227499 RepID=L9X869_9EURY|nr:CAP domain-containing protein [Natronolimnohabitans innermongolicus]ELY57616.1 hypothetical protein C493_09041 [Natronolimnohabitans innermongolicus JCM 12255]
MDDRRSSAAARDDRTDRTDRAVLRSLLRLLTIVALIGVLAFGTAMIAPSILEDAGIDGDGFEGPGGIDGGSSPPPSSESPSVGDREPNVTDPDDPGASRYETDVETIDSETVEEFVHAEVNDRRADHDDDLEALEWDGTVASVARAHSGDMAEQDYFDHVNQEGDAPMERFQDVDDYCRGYGENIALTYVDRTVQDSASDGTVHYQTAEELAEGLVNQWMNSTSHREAILEEGSVPDWDRGGVGVYLTDDGSVYASHNFCQERTGLF